MTLEMMTLNQDQERNSSSLMKALKIGLNGQLDSKMLPNKRIKFRLPQLKNLRKKPQLKSITYHMKMMISTIVEV